MSAKVQVELVTVCFQLHVTWLSLLSINWLLACLSVCELDAFHVAVCRLAVCLPWLSVAWLFATWLHLLVTCQARELAICHLAVCHRAVCGLVVCQLLSTTWPPTGLLLAIWLLVS